ncbi:MAG: peptidase S15, partial [Candidatus Binatia bacterium]
ITPVRGFGTHTGAMYAVGERLAEGDELALLVYGFHAQYPVTWSRDLFVPAITLSGSVELPLLGAADIVRDGV